MCKRCKRCEREGRKETRGTIELPELPEVKGVYCACKRELKVNTAAERGSNMIILHYTGSDET